MCKEEEKLNRVSNIIICDYCLDGKGGICHEPGCIFIRSIAPDLAIRENIALYGGKIERVNDGM